MSARRIRNFEVSVIPGLLQTADYARHRLLEGARMHGGDQGEVESAVAERMRRQEILYDQTRTFEFVVTEAALRLLLCPAPTMRGQLDRLNTLTFQIPNITFGIIPFGVELRTAPQNGFLILDELAIVESVAVETTHTGVEAASYASAMDGLLDEAHTGEAARAIILSAAHALNLTVSR
jgi:hypothetical protein